MTFYLQTLVSFREMDAKKVWDPSRVAFVLDHYAQRPRRSSRHKPKEMRNFCEIHGITNLFDVNCHAIRSAEAGLVRPGMLVVETDSHNHRGALGAGTGCGATDMAAILATEQMWMRLPR